MKKGAKIVSILLYIGAAIFAYRAFAEGEEKESERIAWALFLLTQGYCTRLSAENQELKKKLLAQG